MHKAMYGQHAIHIPCWIKAFESGPGVAFVGASRSTELMYKAKESHILMLGEIIVRPHFVIGSNHATGYGATGLLTENDLDAWYDGTVLADPMGKLKGRNKQ